MRKRSKAVTSRRGGVLGSLALSVALCLSLTPAVALAAPDDGDGAAAAGLAAEQAEPRLAEAPAAADDGIAALADAAAPKKVAQPTPQQIKDYMVSRDINPAADATFTADPSTKSPYAAGALTQATEDNALALLNWMRYIAGIPSDVALDADYVKMAQAASVVNAANGNLSHDPAKPAGMADDLYDLGAAGAGRSNIAYGYASPAASVLGWMADSDSSNINRLGHRRWCLNPSMAKTGFGYAAGFSAMYSFDGSSSVTPTYEAVMWPAANTPTALFQTNSWANGGEGDAWSFSADLAAYGDGLKVTLKRASDGKTWNFSEAKADGYFAVDSPQVSGSYVSNIVGEGGCVIFRPEGIGSYQDGDAFSVTVSGSAKSYSYTVRFFDLYKADKVTLSSLDGSVLSALSLSTASPERQIVAVPGTSADVSKPGAAYFAEGCVRNQAVTWGSSDPAIVTVAPYGPHEQALSFKDEAIPADWGCTLTAKKAGTATVTATLANGTKASVKVTVSTPAPTAKWVKSGNRWWYSYDNGSYATSWKQIDGTWYYFDAAGWMQTGWLNQNGTWYYLYPTGAMATGWLNQGGTWYYLTGSGAMATGWAKVGGAWYYLAGSGAMQTGWLNRGGTWYFLHGSGAMAEGWLSQGGTWYYLNPGSGAMATGWAKVGGAWYYLAGSGAMQTGWLNRGGTWYYLMGSGAMAEGWAKVGGAWYYLNPGSGAMATGWKQVDGTWYYLTGSGAMAANQWIGGRYFVGASGAMATSAWVDGGRYYVGADGAWIPNYQKPGASTGGSTAVTGTVYWAKTGNIYHVKRDCTGLNKADQSAVSSGTLDQARQAGHYDPCDRCAE